jgi:hypothetical protein
MGLQGHVQSLTQRKQTRLVCVTMGEKAGRDFNQNGHLGKLDKHLDPFSGTDVSYSFK